MEDSIGIIGMILWVLGGPEVMILLLAIMIPAMWKVFTKANEPGWACIVPIYNVIVLLRIIGKSWTNIFWFLLLGIGVIILQIIIVTGVSHSFGKKGTGFGAGLFFLPFIFYPILGFGSAKYTGFSSGHGHQNTGGAVNDQQPVIDENITFDEAKTENKVIPENENPTFEDSEIYQSLKEILPNGNPYAFNKLKESYGNSNELITELCNFINKPEEVVVDKADAVQVIGMMVVPENLKPLVSDTFNKAMETANQQSKDDMHPVKQEIWAARKKIFI